VLVLGHDGSFRIPRDCETQTIEPSAEKWQTNCAPPLGGGQEENHSSFFWRTNRAYTLWQTYRDRSAPQGSNLLCQFTVLRKIDPYIANQLRAFGRHGIARYLVGVYLVLVGLLGLSGKLLLWLAELAMNARNKSVRPYLEAKQVKLPARDARRPVFVTGAAHPHGSSRRVIDADAEWCPVESPGVIRGSALE
jgi:hypothetical protein